MPRVLTAQHQQVDWGHPLALGLKMVVTPDGSIIDHNPVATMTNRVRKPGASGRSIQNDLLFTSAPFDLPKQPPLTVVAALEVVAGTSAQVAFAYGSLGASNGWGVGCNTVETMLYTHYGVADYAVSGSATSGHGVFVWRVGGGTATGYRDGILATSTAYGAITAPTQPPSVGDLRTTTGPAWINVPWVGALTFIAIWNRALDLVEIDSVSMDPFQILATPSTRRTYILSPQGAAQSQAPRSMHQYRMRSGRH